MESQTAGEAFPAGRPTKRELEILGLLAEGLTNRQIADRLALAVSTIKWYNRQLYSRLAVENRRDAVIRARELGLLTGYGAPVRPRHNLPVQATPFVGREQELDLLVRWLSDPALRLVTITGPGGMGKTRLAMEVALRLTGKFADGVAFVSLAPLQSADGIVPALAGALRFKPSGGTGEARDGRQQLLDYLADKTLLLVLDNFEHLSEGTALVAAILTVAPRVKMLATSRERLKLQAEQLYPLQGLALVDWETVTQAERDPAVRLFLHYGRRVRPDLTLQPEDLPAVHQILNLVEGMPLAIILASAWLALLAPEDIAAEIERSLDFLEADYRDLPRRQRSMRAVFGSTWARLSERDKDLFAALSVFRGGFTLEAAKEVAGTTLRDLLGLLGRSLLARSSEERFEIHELLRQFAAEKLARSPSREAAIRGQHSAHYLKLLCESESRLKGARSEESLAELAADVENVHLAWEWAVAQQQFAKLARAAFAMAIFSERMGRYNEGVKTFGLAIDALRDHIARRAAPEAAHLTAQATFLAWQCYLKFEVGAFEEAEALGQEALSILEHPVLQEIDARRETALVFLQLGRVYLWWDRKEEAEQMLGQSVSLFRAVGDAWLTADAHRALGVTALRQAQFERSVRRLEEAVRLYESLGDERQKAMSQWVLGHAWGWAGGGDEAKDLMRQAIVLLREIGDHLAAVTASSFLSETLAYYGRFEEARALAADSIKEHERLGRSNYLGISQFHWCWATLHLGDYEAVLDRVREIMDFARTQNRPMLLANCRSVAGCAQLAHGETGKAREQLEEAADGMRQIDARDYLCWVLTALSCALTRKGDLSRARETLLEAVTIGLELPTTLPFVASGVALLALAEGETERAVELYALACEHPSVANSRWFEDVVGRQLDESAARLPPEAAVTARERGRRLELQEAAEALARELAASLHDDG